MAKPKSEPIASPATVAASDAVDRELAAAALEKRRRNETPTARELAALRKIEKQREEDLRWNHYRTIPQKHWRQMSGRQAKVLIEQAQRYGLPIGDAIIDLPKVVRALHDFFADHKYQLARLDDDPALYGPDSPSLERLRIANAKLKELELAERQLQLIPRTLIHERLSGFAAILRRAGDRLQSRFGREAKEMLDQALDDCDSTISNWSFDNGDPPARDTGTPSSDG